MATLLFFAFLSGVITIFAPCIWPLLPLLLSVSAGEGRLRPLGIVSGIVVSFTIFTLFLAYLLSVLPIPPDIFRTIAAVIIILLGLTLLIPAINRMLEGWVSRFSGKFGGAAGAKRKGFGGGFVSGFLLGTLWTPCAGPILAAVATLAATRAVTVEAVFVTLAFAIGVGIPLFIIAQLGQRVFVKSRKLSPYTARIQQVFGVIMILTAMAILTNFDKTIQIKLLDAFPSYSSFLTVFEENEAAQEQLDALVGNDSDMSADNEKSMERGTTSKLDNLGKAPEFAGIEVWLNSEPLTMEALRGKVVLIDFWTYSCINCIRTLPYVTKWHEMYKDRGFTVIGVHTPEFAFERETQNVQNAIDRYDITYPVAQDNDYKTWRAYSNRYWPAHYLIDAEGRIRYTHFGEGKYDETEAAIRSLIEEAGMNVPEDSVGEKESQSASSFRSRTPETYLGSDRMEYAFPDRNVGPGDRDFTLPETLPLHRFAFGGEWVVEDERSRAGENASIRLRFSASKVFLVMSADGAASGEGRVRVLLDGEPAGDVGGADVAEGGVVTVDADRLYELIDLGDAGGEHVLDLIFETPGVDVFAFTFG